jgi:PAS domain S-box-containing protein/diguanylate cyclase (GGDEF)-like protein
VLGEKLFRPAVSIMNFLPFKIKLIASSAVLFLLLILPSRTAFVSYTDKHDIYNHQLIGLSYNSLIHELIQSVQLHRGLSNAFLHGNKSYKKDILVSENEILKQVKALSDFDRQHLMVLQHNKAFANAMGSLEVVKLDSFNSMRSAHEIFSIHSDVVLELIKTFDEISSLSSFANSDDKRVNYIAQMLQEKLLLLEENTGKLRGLATGIFAEKVISKSQKSQLLALYTLIKSLETNLLNNEVLKDLDNYLEVQKQTRLVSYKLKELLYTVNKGIILQDKPDYASSQFFKDATIAIGEQVKLFHLLSNNYKVLIESLHKKMVYDFLLIVVGFLLILLSSIYIFSALYHSIAKSLKKLQRASHMIAEGKHYMQLEVETEDEIGEALIAYNHMSAKLNQNISFLDSYKMAIDETSIVSKTDAKGIITYVNDKFCEVSGFSREDLIGHAHNIVRHPDMPKELFHELWRTIKAQKVWHGVIKNRTKEGSYYIVDATIIPVVDNNGEIIEYIGVRHDVTELEKSKEEIQKQKIDVLTGLANRKQLLEDLESTTQPIIFYLNIDEFASLNDFYGTKVADLVLIYIGKLLQERADVLGYRLYKLYADEFILLFEEEVLNRDSYVEVLEDIISYIEQETIECDAQSCVSVILSGGVAFSQDDNAYTDLIPNAIIARKAAKFDNKKFLLYSKEMRKDDDYANNINWINKIKEALEEERFTTFYQPIIDNKTGAITKYESLVRMIDRDGSVVSPFFFLEIAKKAKLYLQITRLVIDKTFATFKHYPHYEFSINITVEDISDQSISTYIFQKLKEFPHPTKVIFEITESEEIKDYHKVNAFIHRVKQLGAKIAIDDFGSGYANFEHILSLNADFIKIDGSIIKNIDSNEDSRIITEAIIAFSKKLGSKTVVEFVHNEVIYEKAKEMGADFSQGFYLGEPAAELVSMKEFMSKEEALL